MNPTSKDYLGRDIEAWAVTQEEFDNEFFRDLQGQAGPTADPDDLEGNLSEGREEPTDSSVRRFDEKIEDYLDRIRKK